MGTWLALRRADCVAAAMDRKPKKDEPTDIGVGQHVAFAVAVQLASSQLLDDPGSAKDALNIVGSALTKVVPVYFQDAGAATRRALSQAELEGSEVMHRATVLLLKDGRTLSAVSIRRSDLRRGIAVLKTAGIGKLGKGKGRKPATQSRELLAKVEEMERLVRPPLLPAQLDHVNALAVSIARSAMDAGVASLAMRLLSALHDARTAGDSADHRPIELIVARMRDAIADKDK